MRALAFACLIAFMVLGAGIGPTGCVKAPEKINIGTDYYTPAPPATIAPADPNNPDDLARENQQLRDRLAYVQDQNRRARGKIADLDQDIAELQADIDKLARERDRYKAAAGR